MTTGVVGSVVVYVVSGVASEGRVVESLDTGEGGESTVTFQER